MQAALDDVLYVVAAARRHLRHDARRTHWRQLTAVLMHEFCLGLEHAINQARLVERETGFSGEELLSA